MITVYKYPVPVMDSHVLKMPAGARLLSVQTEKAPYSSMALPQEAVLWALVDTDMFSVKRHLRWFGTGKEMPPELGDALHVGTIQCSGGTLVFHLFDLGEK